MSTDLTPPKDQSKYLSKLDGKRVLVIVSSLSSDKVERALDRLRTAYPSRSANISGKTCNLGDPATLEAELKALFEFAGKEIFHIAFSAGGLVSIEPIADVSVEYLQKSDPVRILSPMMVTKIAPVYLLPEPESSITFTSGSNVTKPLSNWSILAALAASLEGLTTGMAQDLKPVRVNLVVAGVVETELLGIFPKEVTELLLQDARTQTLAGIIGRPEDLADAYLYLMKDRFITEKDRQG